VDLIPKLYREQPAGRTTDAVVLWKSATGTVAWKPLTGKGDHRSLASAHALGIILVHRKIPIKKSTKQVLFS